MGRFQCPTQKMDEWPLKTRTTRLLSAPASFNCLEKQAATPSTQTVGTRFSQHCTCCLRRPVCLSSAWHTPQRAPNSPENAANAQTDNNECLSQFEAEQMPQNLAANTTLLKGQRLDPLHRGHGQVHNAKAATIPCTHFGRMFAELRVAPTCSGRGEKVDMGES
jgi:hypothetical protein|mmetsp:Transcript_669/g.1117  ORF Transcript_669/g.1117 Transcript_669/m.1117 type:complete len:164 (+) Transcript_669:65-556(+)